MRQARTMSSTSAGAASMAVIVAAGSVLTSTRWLCLSLARYLSGRKCVEVPPPGAMFVTNSCALFGARENNLQDITRLISRWAADDRAGVSAPENRRVWEFCTKTLAAAVARAALVQMRGGS